MKHRWLAWGPLALSLLFLVTAAVIAVASGTGDGVGTAAFEWALALVFGVVGALITSRHPANPIGWIFLGASLAASSTLLAEACAASYIGTGAGPKLLAGIAADYDQVSWLPFAVAPTTFMLLLAPDGHVLGPRWRWIGWSSALGMIGTFIAQGLVAGDIPAYPELENPFGVDSPVVMPVLVIAELLIAVGIVGSAASLVVRFRRSRGERRLQLKWIALAGAVTGFSVLVSTTAGYVVLGSTISNIIIMLSVMSLPIATGIAILRYRLYDIDVVINRALVYGSLTATLSVVYLGSVLLLQLALSSLTAGSSLAVAASTLAVAALFGPARSRIQNLVDRRFFRSKYDANQTLQRFSAHLRDQVDLSDIGSDLLAVVTETVQPSHVSLWLRPWSVEP